MGGVPKFRLEMARHQERVAHSSAGHVGCPDGIEPLNGPIAPTAVTPGRLTVTRLQTLA
jgi:hypothetical protein